MNIEIQFDIIESVPTLLDLITNTGETSTILWDSECIETQSDSAVIKDAYFCGEVDKDYIYETEYIKENVSSILEDFENGISFKTIAFIDDNGRAEALFVDSEEAMNKNIVWNFYFEKDAEESIPENKEIEQTDSSDAYNEDYYENGKKYIAYKKIDKLSSSISSEELKLIELDLKKDRSKELVKTKAPQSHVKSDFER